MKNLTFSLALLFAFLFAGNGFSADYQLLQNQNVLVEYDDAKYNGQSSGVLIHKKIGGENYSFVLTCAHGVDKAKQKELVFDKVSKKVVSQNKYVKLNIRHVENRADKPSLEKRAEASLFLINNEDDMAVLLIKNRNFSDHNTKFSNSPPKLGEKVITVGNLHGSLYPNSVGDGIIAHLDRELSYKHYLQVTAPIVSGASGGGLYNDKDEYIGTIVRVREANIGFVVPLEQIRDWLERAGAEWLLDGKTENLDKSVLNIPTELVETVEKTNITITSEIPLMPKIEFVIPEPK